VRRQRPVGSGVVAGSGLIWGCPDLHRMPYRRRQNRLLLRVVHGKSSGKRDNGGNKGQDKAMGGRAVIDSASETIRAAGGGKRGRRENESRLGGRWDPEGWAGLGHVSPPSVVLVC
jgi:hypothetical protein